MGDRSLEKFEAKEYTHMGCFIKGNPENGAMFISEKIIAK
jgi:hypothetical protein